MPKNILIATLVAVITIIGPASLNADAKHCKGRRWSCGYPGNSYFGHHHKRRNVGAGFRRCGGYGYNGRGTIVDRLVGNGYGGGYNRGYF